MAVFQLSRQQFPAVYCDKVHPCITLFFSLVKLLHFEQQTLLDYKFSVCKLKVIS